MRGRLQIINKKGGTSIFLVTIFFSMIVAVGILINGASSAAAKNYIDSAMSVAGRSVLAEYDKQLKSTYDIFALVGEPSILEKRAYKYLSSSIEKDSKNSDIFSFKTNEVYGDVKGYSLSNPNLFESQILDVMKYKVLLKDNDKIQKSVSEISQGVFALDIIDKSKDVLRQVFEHQEDIKDIMETIKNIILDEKELEVALANYFAKEEEERNPSQILEVLKKLSSDYEVLVKNFKDFDRETKELLEAVKVFDNFISTNLGKDPGDAGSKILSQINAIKDILPGVKDNKIQGVIEALNTRLNKANEGISDESSCVAKADSIFDNFSWEESLKVFDFFKVEGKSSRKDVEWYENRAKSIENNVVAEITNEGTRVLKNKGIIDGLPSMGKSNGFDVMELISGFSNLEDLLLNARNDIYINEYILDYMENHIKHKNSNLTINNKGGKINGRENEDENSSGKWNTFFANEAEYIICGELGDEKNLAEFKRNFMMLRTGINLIHIYSDPEKNAETGAAAVAIAPGPGAPFAQMAISTAWATFEASEDYKQISDGGQVPLLKNATNWRTSLNGLLSNTISGGTGTNNGSLIDGLSYEDYLRLFLFFVDKEEKLYRIMDLIQINMKGNYMGDFNMKTAYGGFDMEATIERKPLFPSFTGKGKAIGKFKLSHLY